MTIGIFVLLMGIVAIAGLAMMMTGGGDVLPSIFGAMMFIFGTIICVVTSLVSAVEINKDLDVNTYMNVHVKHVEGIGYIADIGRDVIKNADYSFIHRVPVEKTVLLKTEHFNYWKKSLGTEFNIVKRID